MHRAKVERLVSRAPWVVTVLVLGTALGSLDSGAFSGGKFDVTTTGCFCHCGSASAEVVPAIAGLPGSWVPATTYPLTVSFTGGPGFAPGARSNVGGFNLLVRAAMNVNAAAGALQSLNGQTKVQATDAGDATHTPAGNDQSSWNLTWNAPAGPFGDGNVTFRLTTNSVNGDGANGAGACTDRWNSLTATVAGPADTAAPLLSNIVAAPGATHATVSWTTDEPASSRVDYGLTASYGSFKAGAAFVTSHAVQLTGLARETLYHFKVTSTDVAGFVSESGDLTFTTLADDTPPIASLTRPVRGQIYVNDSPRNNPLGANQDPIAAAPTLRVQTTATDLLSGIEKVEFYVDGALRVTVTTPVAFPPNTYQWTWQLAMEIPGNHLLSSVAYDQSGNTRTVGTPIFVL